MPDLRILVGVDGSEAGRHALREAAGLAASLGCGLNIVAVVPLFGGNMDLLTIHNAHEQMVAPFREALTDAENIARAAGIPTETYLQEGIPSEIIAALADRLDINIVVLGRKAGFLERSASGNTVTRVIGYSDADIIVVPEGANLHFKTIIHPTDGSRPSTTAAQRALELARTYGGTLVSIFALDIKTTQYRQLPALRDGLIAKGKGFLNTVREMAEGMEVPFEDVIMEDQAHEAIRKLADSRKASLIVMGSSGRSGLKRLLVGSVLTKVVHSAHCPIYIVH